MAQSENKPSLLVIMDDCVSTPIMKNPIFDELFRNGRHWQITQIKPKYQRMLLIPNPTNDPIIEELNRQAVLFNQLVDQLEAMN